MAKSLRSKSKRSHRAKKRDSGKYAAADAARLNRLNTHLAAIKDRVRPVHQDGNDNDDDDGDDAEDSRMVDENQGQGQVQGAISNIVENGEGMVIDEKTNSVSTHGYRGSRREEWRKSKGMAPVPKRRGMNRQGGLAARRKAGRPSRRR